MRWPNRNANGGFGSAIEALYTSKSPEHKGSLVAKERIKWFLGPNTAIFEQGDIQEGQSPITTTIADVVDDLYELRNEIAHGDKVSGKFWVVSRNEYCENVTHAEALTEAASRIIRASLLKIMEDNLIAHFADGPASEKYFSVPGLTKSLLYAKIKAAKVLPSTQPAKGFFMQFGPDPGTRTPDQQTHGFAAVAQSHDEQPCSSVLSALRVPHHRTRSVIDLRFFSCRSEDDPHRLRQMRSMMLADETLHRLVAAGKAVIGNQVLPDGLGVAATFQPLLDEFAIRFAGTGSVALIASKRPNLLAKVGGHLIGRF